MPKDQNVFRDLKSLKKNMKFSTLCNICKKYFGEPRVRGGHFIFQTPWKGDPRINVQEIPGGGVKDYQVKQVRKALLKLIE